MTTQEAINVLEKYTDVALSKVVIEAHNMAIKALEAQQWIPCSERLPEDTEMVLVTCQTKKGYLSINRAYYADKFWHGSGSMSGVIAWMPLPEPYREAGGIDG